MTKKKLATSALSLDSPCACGSSLSARLTGTTRLPLRAGKLPRPPAEVPVISSLDPLAPMFRSKVLQLLGLMGQKGFTAMVFESYRTDARAQYLYGFGRTYDDGRGIVTNARHSWTTWHGYGLAVDIVERGKLWNASDAFWTALRTLSWEIGLVSGDDWDRDGVPVTRDPDESYSDKPHVQWWIPGMYKSPSPTGQEILRLEGKEAVWKLLRAT